MVEKFYAYYYGNRINAYEALKKRNRSEIVTSPVEKAELFDSLEKNDRYPVKPVKARNNIGVPYFAYYSNYRPEGANVENNKNRETFAHSLFQDVFLNLSTFIIRDGKTCVEVKIDSVAVDRRVWKSKKHYFIVDVLYKLKETTPYSYYYKWNGFLALEVCVTTRVLKEKVDFLSAKGLQICSFSVPKKIEKELKIYDNASDVTPVDEQIYNKKFNKYRFLFESKRYEAYSKLLGSVLTKPEWEEKYVQMKRYEEQEKEMLERIQNATNNLEKLKLLEQEERDKLLCLKKEKENIINEIKKFNKEKRNSESLLQEIKKLSEKNEQLEENQKVLVKKNEELTVEKQFPKKHPLKALWHFIIGNEGEN